MKLYLISQTQNATYNAYRCAVVVAKSEEQAKRVHPDGQNVVSVDRRGDPDCSWVDHPDLVTVKYIGEAVATLKPGVVCADFCGEREENPV